ncbi:MAG: GAF domain-containing protein, partial [Anaerolineales bacterium]|nr:GAF domain-containing protein [Anaerolineales bacterium]
NPLLPETRSEMAVPLLVGERVVGVLDMQSSQPGALNPENQTAFEALAGQLAIAISNAELFAQAEMARQAVEEQARRLTASGWQEFLDAIHHQERLAFTYDRQQVAALIEQLPDRSTDQALAIPLQVAGSSIGRLLLEREAAWTAEDRRVIATVAQQVSQQVENLRLVAQAERYQAEAQAALRRLTREAWTEVSLSQSGYLYSDYEVKALDEEVAADSLTFDIKVRDQAIAQIGLLRSEALSVSDQELLALISEQLGAHLENLRLSSQTEQALTETEQQAKRLAALNALSEQLSRAETIQDVLAAGAFSLNQIVAADRVNIAWLAEDGQQLEVFALQAAEGALPTDPRLSLAGSALGTALSERRVLLIHDLTRSDYPESAQLVRQGLKSSMIVPLLVGDKVPGVLSFSSLEPGAFGTRERDLAIQAASLIAGTLENQDLLAQTRAALDQTEALYEVGRKLNLATNENEILEAVSDLARRSGCKQATLMYIDPDESGQPAWMTIVANWMQSGESAYPVGTRFNLAQFPLTTVMLNSPDRVQLIRAVAQDDDIDEVVRALWLKNGSHAMVIVPMLQAGRWLGIITFSWAEAHTFSQQEQDIYTALTSLATPAVASRRLFAQAQSRAQREQTLRQITGLVRASTDAETIMRTAVRELGQALGRRTFIRLDKPGQDINGNGQGLDDTAE